MNKDMINECFVLAKKYLGLLAGEEKDDIRNQIFEITKTDMIKWIKSIMSNRSDFRDERDLLSIGWECFEFCLKHFKPDLPIPFPNHFYSYTKFYLNMHYLGKGKKVVLVDLSNDLSSGSIDLAYEHLDELRSFRKSLPEEYFSVFDDAVMSLVDCRKDRLRRLDEAPLTYYRYTESKKIFKIVVDYLLRR